MRKTHKLPNVKFTKSYDGSKIIADIDMGRIERNVNSAQYVFDNNVMHSMIPYMPMISGTFMTITQTLSQSIAGTGKVFAGAPPYGRFLYEGKTMVDEQTGSAYARKDAKKVLVSEYSGKTNARVNLQYTTTFHPKAQAEWFESAKKADLHVWLSSIKKEIGKQ